MTDTSDTAAGMLSTQSAAINNMENAPFGAVLGYTSGGIAVYSCYYENCSGPIDAKSVLAAESSVIRFGDTSIYCGCKYQCVEFARRWMILTLGVTFLGIDYAYDIFSLSTVSCARDGTTIPWRSVENGACVDSNGVGHVRPVAGAILIWDKGGQFEHTGHVAVITETTQTSVRIAEQNVRHVPWPAGQPYARELVLQSSSNPTTAEISYSIIDTCPSLMPGTQIKGWKLHPADFIARPIVAETEHNDL